MPSDATPSPPAKITGRCYCGAQSLSADTWPQTVAYCHCEDCKRVTGAPVAAFAAFGAADVQFDPPLKGGLSATPGVTRWFCRNCGSPMAATYDYLPGQVYVSLGLLDQADRLPPQLHAHATSKYPWLHIEDSIPREEQSSRDRLKAARNQ